MTTITTHDGTSIFYKDWGPKDAQPVVCHHGWPLSADDWDNQMLFGSREDGSPEPDFERQVERAFDNFRAVLEAAGGTFDDVIDVTSFHTDPESQFETILKVKNRHFTTKPYPAWTAGGVNWLAGFAFEIKVIARVPGRE